MPPFAATRLANWVNVASTDVDTFNWDSANGFGIATGGDLHVLDLDDHKAGCAGKSWMTEAYLRNRKSSLQDVHKWWSQLVRKRDKRALGCASGDNGYLQKHNVFNAYVAWSEKEQRVAHVAGGCSMAQLGQSA
ncbi:hypothetical protein [Sulfitobacter sp. TBRI5]|uniref:hypothetical protein n=1 Tax=Sulfitobacter sp. TBRI5 TaxID=2989732 RepID=UPI003D9B9288